jgi:predicted NBD/HSP70 family sugar kinase
MAPLSRDRSTRRGLSTIMRLASAGKPQTIGRLSPGPPLRAGTASRATASSGCRGLDRAGCGALLAERAAAQASAVTGSAAMIAEGALNGDCAFTELIARSAQVVGENVASVVSFFYPRIVAIGAVIATAGDPFLAVVSQIVYRRLLALATPQPYKSFKRRISRCSSASNAA